MSLIKYFKFMKTSTVILCAICFIMGSISFAASLPNVRISGGYADITTPTGKEQVVKVGDAISSDDAKFSDLTFSGKKLDLMILRERGANQEYYDVYLYSIEKDEFIFNDELSHIPCLVADSRIGQLVGACFHENACENWEERYSVALSGKISLVERRGTYCDQDGRAYSYVDAFKGGRKISSRVKPIEDGASKENKNAR